MKRMHCNYLLLVMALGCASLVRAQTSFDVTAGVGANFTKSTGVGLDTQTYGICSPSASAPTCSPNPGLSGAFMGLSGEFMLNKRLGFGAEANFTPERRQYFSAVYGQLAFRQTFYDFNAIYAVVHQERFTVKLFAGVGGAKTGFGFTTTSCVQNVVCSTSTQPVGSDNHFAAHVGIGPEIFVTSHVFLRPQFNYYYVPGLRSQFGNNSVPGFMVSAGYAFGSH